MTFPRGLAILRGLKTIGIVGGLSPESTVTYYQTILRRHRRETGNQIYPRIVIASVPFGQYAAWQHAGDWDAIARGLDHELAALHAAGADIALLATNTMHKVLPQLSPPLPVLDIIDVVADAARALGMKRLGLTGTAFTMGEPFFRDRLRARGLDVVVPSAPAQAEIHRIIYEELVVGRIEDRARAAFDGFARDLLARGAEAVILGCTELELLVRGREVDYATLDTATLHAESAWELAAR